MVFKNRERTTHYIVLGKARERSYKAGKNSLRFDERVEKAEGRTLVKECVRKRRQESCTIKNSRERTEYIPA